MHLCTGNLVVAGRVVVYYARAAHTFSAGNKCRHCTFTCMVQYLEKENSVLLDSLSWFSSQVMKRRMRTPFIYLGEFCETFQCPLSYKD